MKPSFLRRARAPRGAIFAWPRAQRRDDEAETLQRFGGLATALHRASRITTDQWYLALLARIELATALRLGRATSVSVRYTVRLPQPENYEAL